MVITAVTVRGLLIERWFSFTPRDVNFTSTMEDCGVYHYMYCGARFTENLLAFLKYTIQILPNYI